MPTSTGFLWVGLGAGPRGWPLLLLSLLSLVLQIFAAGSSLAVPVSALRAPRPFSARICMQ